MKKFPILFPLMFWFGVAHAQMMGPGSHMGPGMMGQGWSDQEVDVPQKLPPPTDSKWSGELEAALAAERQTRGQYEADAAKYGAGMPYAMIIPQEANHIRWLAKLLAAYGLPGDARTEPGSKIVTTETLQQAYQLGLKLEADLIAKYEALLRRAPDDASRSVLGSILLQTRFHHVMFDHALRMGGPSGGMMKNGSHH